MLKSSVNFGLFYNIRISVQCLCVILIFFVRFILSWFYHKTGSKATSISEAE